ncbi:MAG: hypothetical protein WC761_05830 [Candidatus Paceibacterota bacterium]|jgi:hypothetical protein
MNNKDKIVKAQGVIGTVYRSYDNLEVINEPRIDIPWGWMQITENERLKVEVCLLVPAVPAQFSWVPLGTV